MAAVIVFFAGQLAALPAPPAPAIEVGDRLQLHIAFYDVRGNMLASSDEADVPELEAVKANFSRSYVLPSTFKPIAYEVKPPDRIEQFDNSSSYLLSKDLIGKWVGASTIVPLMGNLEGYTEQVSLERQRGPFNLTATIGIADFDRLAASTADGQAVIDELIPVLVSERDDTRVTLQMLVLDGDQLPVRQAGFVAHVRREASSPTFTLFLDTTVGHEFSVQWKCKIGSYVLPAGTYRVDSIDEQTITLAKSPHKLPQLPLAAFLGVRVIEVEKAAGLGGDNE